MTPDAVRHVPDSSHTRELLKMAKLSQSSAARLIGVDQRTMRSWLSDATSATPIPYSAQFCLECLAQNRMGRNEC